MREKGRESLVEGPLGREYVYTCVMCMDADADNVGVARKMYIRSQINIFKRSLRAKYAKVDSKLIDTLLCSCTLTLAHTLSRERT